MQRHVVALTLAAGLLMAGSAASAVVGVAPPSGGTVVADSGATARFGPPFAAPHESLLSLATKTALGPPTPGADALLGAVADSPSGRRLFDLAHRARTGRRFPAVPTAVPGGLGDPFVGLPPGSIAAYGTGIAYHTDVDLSGQRGSALDIAFASAAYSSAPGNARFDELDHRVSPPFKAAGGYGQGDAAQVGALEQPGQGESEISTRVESSAPPNRNPQTADLTEVNGSPFIDADVLHAAAAARSAASGCVVGSDLAYGLSSATDTKALAFGAEEATVSTDGDGPKRAASQTLTRTRLVPRPGSDHFGLMVETRQTIAPTTIRQGTPDEMTIEVAGEWILRVVVDGAKSHYEYGPDPDTPETVVLRVTRPEHPGEKNRGNTIEVAKVTAQELLGNDGAVVEITPGRDIVIGELARAIRDDHGSTPLQTATRIAAAVDVARVVLKDVPGADLRIGHMEAAATVPPDGIACPGIGVVKQLDQTEVRPGDRFTWVIDVSNANDCMLDKVKVTDTITASPGVRYRVVSSDPKAATSSDGSVVFDGVGPVRQGETRRLQINVEVDDLSAPGSFADVAVADGVCGPDRRNRIGDDDDNGIPADPPIPVSGRAELAGPTVGTLRVSNAVPPPRGGPVSPAPSPAMSASTSSRSTTRSASTSTSSARLNSPETARTPLAATGGLLGVVPAVVLLGGGSLLRRFRRRLH